MYKSICNFILSDEYQKFVVALLISTIALLLLLQISYCKKELVLWITISSNINCILTILKYITIEII